MDQSNVRPDDLEERGFADDPGKLKVLNLGGLLMNGLICSYLSEVKNKALLFLVRSEMETGQVCKMTKSFKGSFAIIVNLCQILRAERSL
ncbi:hypothetical protein L1987_65089 [Smallanthus sonchifolius]|uniref:Uncharacterized protein n=1 Tax=Smallanthus sonchifolius TaxID=185202 RepID=A0ACB9BTL3_9ASTR|nr:hypothetical protein L1987_65089 [Smallanthus sonchifolius]